MLSVVPAQTVPATGDEFVVPFLPSWVHNFVFFKSIKQYERVETERQSWGMLGLVGAVAGPFHFQVERRSSSDVIRSVLVRWRTGFADRQSVEERNDSHPLRSGWFQRSARFTTPGAKPRDFDLEPDSLEWQRRQRRLVSLFQSGCGYYNRPQTQVRTGQWSVTPDGRSWRYGWC